MKKALLVVSVGTSDPDALEKNITAIENDLAAAMPDRELHRAFTGETINLALIESRGLVVKSAAAVLETLSRQAYRDLVVSPTFVLNGGENMNLKNLVSSYESSFERIRLGAPLFSSESDYITAARALISRLPEKRMDTAHLFIGHGVPDGENREYAELERVMHTMGRTDVIIGALTGAMGFGDVCRRLAGLAGVKNTVLNPLMTAGGHHAKRGLCGRDDSLKALLENRGYKVSYVLRFLGEYPEIRGIFVGHALAAQGREE